MSSTLRLLLAGALFMTMSFHGSASPSMEELESSLRETEIAFAKTMADRDLEAFASFIADDAVFSTSRRVLRGKTEIVEGWRPLYEGPEAPFSWKPERVHVLDDASLGGTTGPVLDRDGNVIGHFVSTWKRQPDGTWKIVMDLSPGE